MGSDRITRVLAAVLLITAGCMRSDETPRIRVGDPCATCGMAVRDERFACLRRDGAGQRQYDSIECLLKDGRTVAGERIFLADYDRGALAPAESLWVVRGAFPSPMGGGFAAFATLDGAREVAERTSGRVARLAELTTGMAP